jgi:hypothetical protein
MHFHLTSLLLSLVNCGPDNFFWSFERVGLLGLGWAWYWDQTMNQVFELAGDLVPPKVAHDLMRLLAEGAGEDDEEADSLLRSSAVESYLHVLGEPKLPSVLLQVQSCDGFVHLGLCLGVKQNGCTDT